MSAVSEIVSRRKIVTLRNDLTPSALDAAKLMVKNKVGSVVVVDVEGKPVGIVTERDLLKKVTAQNKSPKEVVVEEIMSFPVITIKAYDSIETAAAVMKTNKIKRLIVMEQDGSLLGVLSITDITRKLAKILADEYDRYGRMKTMLDF
ncbi:MAG TPA: CBS domain-containing protein [Nitrososphaera sp.]|nr:CBS domain-containing protein [Nitrososphaera sp.]